VKIIILAKGPWLTRAEGRTEQGKMRVNELQLQGNVEWGRNFHPGFIPLKQLIEKEREKRGLDVRSQRSRKTQLKGGKTDLQHLPKGSAGQKCAEATLLLNLKTLSLPDQKNQASSQVTICVKK